MAAEALGRERHHAGNDHHHRDDHPLFRGAMRQALSGMAGAPAIVEAGDFAAARRSAADNPDADLMLLDLTMPGVSGLSGLIALRAEFPSLPVMIVSAHDDPATIHRALDLERQGSCPNRPVSRNP